jgi:hypothetical protein
MVWQRDRFAFRRNDGAHPLQGHLQGRQFGARATTSLKCASDSYKFELSSNVTSQGDRIIGTWSEAGRNINGNLQGTAGGGQIDVFVEAAGFAATLNVVTRGNKQAVSISSKGEIRAVSISMVRS